MEIYVLNVLRKRIYFLDVFPSYKKPHLLFQKTVDIAAYTFVKDTCICHGYYLLTLY